MYTREVRRPEAAAIRNLSVIPIREVSRQGEAATGRKFLTSIREMQQTAADALAYR